MAHRLLKYGQNSTFDLRNSKAFNSATGGSFGQGTGTTAKSSLDAKYRRRSDFHNRLNEGGQEKHLNYLKGYNLFSSKEVARRLEGKQRLNFDEKLNADKSFNKKFEKANKEADENKRLEKIKDIADEHFKENGKGKKYFTDALEKAENAKFKKDLEDANKETDERTRKEAISKVIKEFEEEEKKQNKNNSSGQQSGQQNTNQQNQNNTQGQAGNTTRTGTGTNTQTGSGINRNGPAPSVKNESAQNSLKNRLQAKYGDSEQVGLRSQLQKESAAANMRIETKARKEENQRYNSDQYQKQVLSDLEEKNRFKNMSEDTKRIREGIENLNKNFSEGLKEFNSSLLNNIKNSNSMSKNTTNSPNMSKVDGDDMIEKRTERNVNKKPTKDANENDYINNNNRNAA